MLHIVTRSPFTNSALSECLTFCTEDSYILLMGGGVYAIDHPLLTEIKTKKVFAITEDVKTRGLNARAGIEYIDYQGMVELTVSCHPIQTWS